MEDNAGSYLRSLMLHLPAVVAGGAVVLYVLGVIYAAGQLRASHLDLTQAMGLISVERHLRSGLGILIRPGTLLIVALFAFTYWLMVRTAPKVNRALGDPQVERRGARGCPAIVSLVLVSVGSVICALIIPWNLALAVVLAGVLGSALIARRNSVGRAIPNLHVGSFVALTLGVSAFGAYFLASPLPRAVVTADGRIYRGPLIGITDGVVYLASEGSGGPAFVAVGGGAVNSIAVYKRVRRVEPSLLTLVGFR